MPIPSRVIRRRAALATSVVDPTSHSLVFNGLSVPDAIGGGGAAGYFTLTNHSHFGALGAAGESFGAVVVDSNDIVVAVGATAPNFAGGNGFDLPTGYEWISPGQNVELSGGVYKGLAIQTTAIAASYAGQTLTFTVAPWAEVQGISVGSLSPFVDGAWLSASFGVQALNSPGQTAGAGGTTSGGVGSSSAGTAAGSGGNGTATASAPPGSTIGSVPSPGVQPAQPATILGLPRGAAIAIGAGTLLAGGMLLVASSGSRRAVG